MGIASAADAVAAAINAGTYSRSFTSVRSWRPTGDIADEYAELVVEVVPMEIEVSRRETRGLVRREYLIDVAIIEPLADYSNQAIDLSVALTEAIMANLKPGTLIGSNAFAIIEADAMPVVVRDRITDHQQYLGQIRLKILDMSA